MLICLCGIPGSGKSTVARVLRAELERHGVEVRSVAFDDNEVSEDERNETTFRASRVAALRSVESELQSFLADNVEKFAVVVDDIMYLRSMRRQLYVLGRQHAVPLAVVWVQTSLPTALARNAAREALRRIPEATIVKLHSHFEAPSRLHTADRLSFVLANEAPVGVEGGEALVQTAVRHLVAQLEPQAEQRRAELVQLMDSLLAAAVAPATAATAEVASGQAQHELDLALRRLTSRVLAAYGGLAPDARRSLAAALSTTKAEVLAKARATPPSEVGVHAGWLVNHLEVFVDEVMETVVASCSEIDRDALCALLHPTEPFCLSVKSI